MMGWVRAHGPSSRVSDVLMASRRLFTVQTPPGVRVFLTRDRWRQIVRFKHPSLDGHEDDVRDCLQSPSLVRESVSDPEVHLYYAPRDAAFLCVVTAPAGGDERFVVTAYVTKNIKQGRETWKK
jgi:hypothetical protein